MDSCCGLQWHCYLTYGTNKNTLSVIGFMKYFCTYPDARFYALLNTKTWKLISLTHVHKHDKVAQYIHWFPKNQKILGKCSKLFSYQYFIIIVGGHLSM